MKSVALSLADLTDNDGVLAMAASQDNTIRNNWQREEVLALFNQPFNDLLFDAQVMHRRHFNPNQVQLSTLLSIKTGACPEDCKYCPQSARYDTGLEKEKAAGNRGGD